MDPEPARINEIKREGDAPSITSTWPSNFSFFYKCASKATLQRPYKKPPLSKIVYIKGGLIYVFIKSVYINIGAQVYTRLTFSVFFSFFISFSFSFF